MRRSRATVIVTVGLLAAASACVDLFHSTDFPTLCDEDAAACNPGNDAASDASDAATAPVLDCAGGSAEARSLAEHACSFLGACLGTTEGSRFGDCMVRALAAFDCSVSLSLRPRGDAARLWKCLSTAQSCADVSTCVYGTVPAPLCTGGSSPSFTACNEGDAGTAVIECGEPTTPLGTNPCALQGRTCLRPDKSNGLCVGKGGVDCHDTDHCDGTHAVHCQNVRGIALDEGFDCAAFGKGSCVTDSDGVACEPSAESPPCTGTSKLTCVDGGIAQSCVGGRVVQVDCAALGLGCDATDAGAIDPVRACKNFDAGCASTTDECVDGGHLRGCALGMPFDVDCTTVPGLGACVPGSRPTCAPPR